jgi:hypothetical protein
MRCQHRLTLIRLMKTLRILRDVKDTMEDHELAEYYDNEIESVKTEMLNIVQRVLHIVCSPAPILTALRQFNRTNRTIDSFNDEECKQFFRFNGREQLQRLRAAFLIPDKFTYARSGNVFLGDEALLVTLFKFHERVTNTNPFFSHIMGLSSEQVSMAINCFLDFFIFNWAYLIMNNMEYWKPYFPQMLVECMS